MFQVSCVAGEAEVVRVTGAAGVAMISLANYAGTTGLADRLAAAALPANRPPMTAATRTFLFNMFEKLLSLGLLFMYNSNTGHHAPIAYTCRRRHLAIKVAKALPLCRRSAHALTVRSPQCIGTIGGG